jgi:hypothetical protein
VAAARDSSTAVNEAAEAAEKMDKVTWAVLTDGTLVVVPWFVGNTASTPPGRLVCCSGDC